jgi:pimeloyl-ACP methyl ester carboxylesterase
MSPIHLLLVLSVTGASILGCVGPVKHEMTTDYPAAILRVVGTPPAIDGRARFREIFCQLLAEEPEYREPDGACQNFLLRLSGEPLPGSRPHSPPNLNTRYRVMVVPGFLNECFASIALPFEDAIPLLNERGIKIEQMAVSGRSSSDANAVYIAETIENLNLDEDEKLVLVGHSKGAVDILHFIVNFPQVSRRVAAVVSVAGAINGSPVAFKLDEIYTDLARNFLSGRCNTGDDGALDSLKPSLRLSWLAANPLPESVRYFSLAALTKRDNINTLLKTGYDLLRMYSPRNDGLLLISDQLIPGGTLLGYANADHWSVVLPLENKNFLISETVQAPQQFPRKVLLQALLVYVVEALEPNRE